MSHQGEGRTYICDVCLAPFEREEGRPVDRVELITPRYRIFDLCPSCATVVSSFMVRAVAECRADTAFGKGADRG